MGTAHPSMNPVVGKRKVPEHGQPELDAAATLDWEQSELDEAVTAYLLEPMPQQVEKDKLNAAHKL